MAQFYYDLSIAAQDCWPYFLGGEHLGNNLLRKYVAPTKDGFLSVDGTRQAISGAAGYVTLSLGLDYADIEALLRVSLNATPDASSFGNSSLGLWVRTDGGISGASPTIGYGVCTNANTSLGSFDRSLTFYANGSSIANATNVIPSYGVNEDPPRIKKFLFLKINATGTLVRMKAWFDGDTEPGWQISETRTDTASGDVSVRISHNFCNRVFDFVSVGTDGDPAPLEYPGGPRQVIGTVRKPDDTLAAGYIVRCYHRPTGCLLGETITDVNGGFVFSINIPETEQVYCLAVDQLGNSWNAPIKDLINPGAL